MSWYIHIHVHVRINQTKFYYMYMYLLHCCFFPLSPSQAGAIARQALSKPIKALSRPSRSQSGPRLEFHSSSSLTNQQSRSRSPSPRPTRKNTDLAPLDEDLFAEPSFSDRGKNFNAIIMVWFATSPSHHFKSLVSHSPP